MEKVIKIATEHNGTGTIINIDNSTEYKDFTIVKTGADLNEDKDTNTAFQLQLDKSDAGTPRLEIGHFTLIGREVELLKEFLNQ